MHPDKQTGCLSETVIAELALGTRSPQESAVMLSHIAQCDRCGHALKEAVECFDKELKPDEEAAVEAALTRRPAMPRTVRRPHALWSWALAAALALTIGLGSYSYIRSAGSAAIPGLLAEAYTAQRPFLWRLPDAGYTAVPKQERGTLSQIPSEPLVKAEDRLASSGGSERETWLAWTAVLKRDPQAAITRLSAARELDLQALEVLSVAYALRGDLTGSRADYERALGGFDRILKARPDDPRSAFNRALAMQRSGRREEALQLLELTPKLPSPEQAWSRELRVELEGIR
jgi:tetratricopeptide (TPR) repeat protein